MQPPTEARWSTRLLIIALGSLVFVPILFYGCEGELARWRAASAIEAYASGQKQAALAQLQSIVERHPQATDLQQQLAVWYLNDGQAERALEIVAELRQNNPSASLQSLYEHCLMAVGRRGEALQTYKQSKQDSVPSGVGDRILHKNTLAYYRALADEELELAASDIQFVLHWVEGQWNSSHTIKQNAQQQARFCAACLYYFYSSAEDAEVDWLPRALQILDVDIAALERFHASLAAEHADLTAVQMKRGFPFAEETGQELLKRRSQMDRTTSVLAAFLTLRALVLQEQQELTKSVKDRLRVKQLGFDSEEIAADMPTPLACELQLGRLFAFLDTRGCVSYRRDELLDALQDMDAAVGALQAVLDLQRQLAVLPAQLAHASSLQPDQSLHQRLSVLLQHRSWVFDTIGASEKMPAVSEHFQQRARQDENRIRELGYVPGNTLF